MTWSTFAAPRKRRRHFAKPEPTSLLAGGTSGATQPARRSDFGDQLRSESQALRATHDAPTKPRDPVLAAFASPPHFEDQIRSRALRVRRRAPEDVVLVVPKHVGDRMRAAFER